jgi:hypothetical protein
MVHADHRAVRSTRSTGPNRPCISPACMLHAHIQTKFAAASGAGPQLLLQPASRVQLNRWERGFLADTQLCLLLASLLSHRRLYGSNTESHQLALNPACSVRASQLCSVADLRRLTTSTPGAPGRRRRGTVKYRCPAMQQYPAILTDRLLNSQSSQDCCCDNPRRGCNQTGLAELALTTGLQSEN